MKVLFVTEQTILGGGEINLANVIHEYLIRGVDVYISAPKDAKIFSLLPSNVTIIEEPKLLQRGWFSFFPLFWRQIKPYSEQFDFIHFYSSNVITKFLFFKGKKIWTIHGYWECRSYLKGLVSSLFVKNVTCVSLDVKNTVGFWKDKARVVELSVGSPLFDKLIRLKKSKPNDSCINVLCLGRFQKIKRQDLLISALSALPFNIECKMIGAVNDKHPEDKRFYKKCLLLAEELMSKDSNWEKNIHISTHVLDPSTLFLWADICVIPSDYESFSMVTVESLLSSTPIVITDAGAPKFILGDGVAGETFQQGDAVSLSNAILMLINRLHTIKADHFEGYKTKYCIVRQVNEYISFYLNEK
jgi:glycosyltransferase involved in cell wall biosynthesis